MDAAAKKKEQQANQADKKKGTGELKTKATPAARDPSPSAAAVRQRCRWSLSAASVLGL